MRVLDAVKARARAASAFLLVLPERVLARIRSDYARAKGFVGYVKLRLRDKATWGAIAGGVASAGMLRPPYAAMAVCVAIVIALLPTP